MFPERLGRFQPLSWSDGVDPLTDRDASDSATRERLLDSPKNLTGSNNREWTVGAGTQVERKDGAILRRGMYGVPERKIKSDEKIEKKKFEDFYKF